MSEHDIVLAAIYVRDRKSFGPESNALAAAALGLMRRKVVGVPDEALVSAVRAVLYEAWALLSLVVLRAHYVEGRRVPRDVLMAAQRIRQWQRETKVH